MDLKQHRALALCRRGPRGDLVELKRRAEKTGYRAHFAQLVYCGKPICPLCGPKIAVERAADIALALSAHYAAGGQVLFATYTLRHHDDNELPELLTGVSKCWTAIRANKGTRGLLAELTCGWIKRLETTVGVNGWHPHLHVFRFLNPGVTEGQAERLACAEYRAWAASATRQGLGTPDPDHGVVWKILDLSTAHEKAAEYAAKSASLELASAGTKRARRASSRTPLQVLYDFGENGESRDRALWFCYVEAMHGRHHLEWSQGLRARLLADAPEVSDEDAAASDDNLGKLLGLIDRDTWMRISRSVQGPARVLDWAELYDDDDEAFDAVDRYLARAALGRLFPPTAPESDGAQTRRPSGVATEPGLETDGESPEGTVSTVSTRPALRGSAGGARAKPAARRQPDSRRPPPRAAQAPDSSDSASARGLPPPR